MSRNTVNGIKVKDIDEKTRSIISRSGDIAQQVRKASELNVLDENHYKGILRGLKKDPKFKKMIMLISLYGIYGFSLLNIGRFILYGLL